MRPVLLSLFTISLFSCGGEPPLVVPGPTTSRPPASSQLVAVAKPSPYGYPPTAVHPVTDVVQGVSITDPYRWLEDGKSDETKAWLKIQDDFARSKLKALPERDAIAARLKELFYVEAHSIPARAKKKLFFARRDAGKEKWIVYYRDGKDPAAKAILDPNTWSTDGSVSLGNWEESQDGAKIAYAVKSNNSDEATMYVIDVATGKKSDTDVIEGAKYARASWTPKGDGFYYTRLPMDPAISAKDRPGFAEVYFHKLGDDPKNDPLIHEKTGDAKTFLGAEISRDGHFLLATISHGWASNDVYFRDLRKGQKDWTPLVVGKPAKYGVVCHGDKFYLRTDEGAARFRMFRVDPAHAERDKWEEIVKEDASATLESFSIVGGRLTLSYLKDVISRIEVHELSGKKVRDVPLPGVGAASVLYGNPEDDEAYWSFTSFTYPTDIYQTSMKTGESKLFYRTKVPVDASKFVVEQIFATSKDGTKVPAFVVRPNDLKKDGTAPTLIYGYGGFTGTQKPGFTSSIFPWIERGGVYVLANLRGGGEYGEDWHKAGMGQNKQNVFDDLYAVTQKLIDDKVTSASKIALRGASNGGLLVGAAVTQRPDLYRVGLCGVPLLDMVRYHLFGSGTTWVPEYGSSNDPLDFKALYAYSPYHHVTAGTKYPSLLVLSADSDDRVAPLHAWKFAALMQARSGGGPVYLRIEKNSGHGGADLVRASVEKTADELAFAWSEIQKPN